MNDAQLLERLAWTDEYPPPTPLPDDIWTVDAISREVERRTGMTQTADHKAPETGRPPGRTRLMFAAAAAFVVVILLGVAIWAISARETGGEVIEAPPETPVVATTEATPANPETSAADIGFIERFVDTWFESGDSLLAMTMIGETADGSEDDATHLAELTYQAAIEADVTVSDCVPVDGQRTYGCTVSYSNMLFEAVDASPLVTGVEFEIVSDGRIAPFAEDTYPGNNYITAAWSRFEEEAGLALDSTCRVYGSDPVACPALQREHLDEFVALGAFLNQGAATTVATDPEVAADLSLIELHLATWFESGDFELALGQIGSNPREGASAGSGGIVSEILYQAAIEAQVTVADCRPLAESRTYECAVGYSNDLYEALGEPASETTLEFRVIADGLLSPMPYDDRYPGINRVSKAWLQFEREAGLTAESSCDRVGSNSVSCPQLQRDHLDEFVAWWAETQG